MDDGTNGMLGTGTPGVGDPAVPEDTLTRDGWPTTIRFVGPGDTYGSGVVIDIDSDA